MAMINQLIDSTSAQQRIVAIIYQLLVDELDNQQLLAAAESKNPTNWDFRIFAERARAYELFRSNTGNGIADDRRPVINIKFSRHDRDDSRSSLTTKVYDGEFYIDFHALGVTTKTTRGDTMASTLVQRAAHIVEQIIMAGAHVQFSSEDFVWGIQKITSAELYESESASENFSDISSMRLTLRCMYSESNIEGDGAILEQISIDVTDAITQESYQQLEFNNNGN